VNNSITRAFFGFVSMTIALAACAGNSTPNAAPGSQAPPAAVSDAGGHINFSGQYTGTLERWMKGTARVKTTLAQYRSAVGGAIHFGGKNASTADVAWNANGAAVTATFVAVQASGFCQFAMQANYDTKKSTLLGKWYATHGCSGEQGSVSLKHECVYKVAGGENARPQNGPRPC
jgi:hypothetical protein